MMMNWYLDFDDTLAVGPITWALQHILPEMIQVHNLPYDETLFTQVILKAQQLSNQGIEEAPILDEMFTRLGWPDHLKTDLGQKVYTGYSLALFEDTVAFLDHLRGQQHRMFIISNNNKAAEYIEKLGIATYFTAILTPLNCGDVPGKPNRAMWDYLLTHYPDIKGQDAYFVGDDPWSDGLFAEACELSCWIVDRMQRYHTLYTEKPYHWATSLHDLIK